MVFASPHSGRLYPAEFLALSPLEPQILRRSEDSFVDELWANAIRQGAPMLKALFPRAYLDVNREAYELDPSMFEDALPSFVNAESPRVVAGLGTIAKLVSSGAEIYRRKLTFAEVEQRIEQLYRPYHVALRQLVEETRQQFGYCILIDCHSMPSGGAEATHGHGRVDFVLGDCFGSACVPQITRGVDAMLSHLGYRCVRNSPYAGGYTTRHYGAPETGVHALQIEINRRLYMDEATHVRNGEFPQLQSDLGRVIAALAALPADQLLPRNDRA
jgi:N-formylglutamate amidohydrolase